MIGTTGLSEADDKGIAEAARQAPIVRAPNMSLAVNLLLALTEQVAARLGPEFDIEIVEIHHRHKVDAPSGTALALGEAAARGRAASSSRRSPSAAATAIPGRGRRAGSASRRCAAAPRSATTP